MIDIIKNISNKIKGYYLLWVGLHLSIYFWIASYFSNDEFVQERSSSFFFPIGEFKNFGESFSDVIGTLKVTSFYLPFYDISELTFYTIAPPLLYVSYKLITDSKEDE